MKTKFKLICTLICCMLSVSAFSQTHSVTKAEALSIAQREFQGKDVDYFLKEDGSQTSWTIFVDAEPMKGWEHECYTLIIPKSITTSVDTARPSVKITQKLPPSGAFVPLSVKNRYGTNSVLRPIVANTSQSNSDNTTAQRTYAIILSGGVNVMSNHERYWNDCSFIYQTLVNKYGVPKANIYPIMSDGNNPAEDMMCIGGSFKSQPLDLDNDGVNDIQLAATKSNIQNTLTALNAKLQEDDHLFIFVIDHGGTSDGKNSSYICLWNNERLKDSELATMLEPFTKKYVNVNVVLGQCNSGGFIDDLTKVGCVVAAASTGSEYSWSCPDIPYDEFVYQWTCAVNGADHRKVGVNADTDNNGRVTMQEAFEYAKAHDRRTAEHPQYVSTPVSIGEDLAFDNIAESIDLYIQDNPEDTGKEPNMTTDKFWLSPSIWVRNKADGVYEHENPYYSEDHFAASIYVRVHNRGKKDYEGNGQFLHVYWAKASTGFKPLTWMGNELYDGSEVTGGSLVPICIPNIKAGEYRDIRFTWALPPELGDEESGSDNEKHHYCLLAKIMETHLGPSLTGSFWYNCKDNNNHAQKNVSIISRDELSSGTTVFVRNIYEDTRKYSLELRPRTSADDAIFSHARVMMNMSQPIYSGWEIGGSQSNGVSRAPAVGSRTVELLSKDNRLDAIALAGKVFDKVSLKFNFKTVVNSDRKYTVDLIQRDENGVIIGGETFVVESPRFTDKQLAISSMPGEDGKTLLTVDVDSNESVRWEAEDGTVIGEKETVEVLPKPNSDNTYHVYVLSENGELATDCIELVSVSGIDRVSMDEVNDVANIYLKGQIVDNSSIVVSSVISGEKVFSYDLHENDNSIACDMSSLQKGIYIVSYLCKGEVIDSVKLSK